METEIIERLYRSEINIQIESFYDAGFYGRLGDYINGTSIVCCRDTYKEVVIGLAHMASNKYPRSDFAKWWNEQNGS